MVDTEEFLSDHGIRSLSKHHQQHPFRVRIGGLESTVTYLPGVSDSGMFGGNSNWRGPVWMPINYLLIEAVARYGEFYGDAMRVPLVGHDEPVTLDVVSEELNRRLTTLFINDQNGRPCLASSGNQTRRRPVATKRVVP